MKNIEVGDVWFRAVGEYVDDGSETYAGMELEYQEWEAVKITMTGAWFRQKGWNRGKQRFASRDYARWISRTKFEALQGLAARKRRHIAIVTHQLTAAKETLELANAAILAVRGAP